MRTRLVLEGINLDLYEDIDTTFTYAIDDVNDFGSKNTSYSKTISIPGNAVNNKAFGNVFNLSSSNDYDNGAPNIGYNFNPSKSARCIVLIDQIQVFKGSLRLTEIINTDGTLEYQCFIYGELGGFIFELGNRRLEDLDFSEYNQNYTLANITNSWNAVNGQGVAYPLIDYGNVSTNKVDFQYKAFRPALYVREYLEKIISGTDYTVESNFLLTPLFDRLAIPYNRKNLDKVSTQYMSATINEQEFAAVADEYILSYTGVSLGNFSLIGGGFNIQYDGATPITVDIEFRLTGQIGIIYAGGDPQPVNLILQKNNVGIDSITLLPYTEVSTTEPMDILVRFNGVNLVTGDRLRMVIPVEDASRGLNTIVLEIDAGIALTFGGGTGLAVPINIGEAIPINKIIPKGIFQKDFFIWILKMFNLYVYESPFDDKKIIIAPYVGFYPTTAANAIDISQKVDRKEPIRSIPMSELNARYFRFKYKEDNDFYNEEYRKGYNEGYGDFIYDTEFDFSKDTDDLEVGFSNSVLYQNTGTDKVYPAIYKLSGTTETSMDFNIRIVQMKKMSCNSYNILNGVTNLGTQANYLYCGHVNDPVTPTSDLCFGAPQALQFTPTGVYPSANLFNSFYSAYMAEITDKDSKLVACKAYLNTVDIMTLDFSKLIYLDGVLFRLNKIKDYNPVDLGTTEIQLLKVIDL
jgi:hypothetical protein